MNLKDILRLKLIPVPTGMSQTAVDSGSLIIIQIHFSEKKKKEKQSKKLNSYNVLSSLILIFPPFHFFLKLGM